MKKTALVFSMMFSAFAPFTATAYSNTIMFHIEFRVIEADGDDYVRIADAYKNSDGIVTNYTAILRELSACKNTDLIGAASVMAVAGSEVVVKDVTEYLYPTAFDVEMPETTNSMTVSPVVVEPQDFQMREVGLILRVQPEISSNGKRVYVAAVPQIVYKPEWKDYGTVYTDSKGNKLQCHAEQPFFPTHYFALNVDMGLGESLLLGSTSKQHVEIVDTRTPILWRISRIFGTKTEIKKERITLAFLTVTPTSQMIYAKERAKELAEMLEEAQRQWESRHPAE